MYSMSLNTIGYLAITLLFAIIFIGAYSLRHRNTTYQNFLLGQRPRTDVAYWVGDLGLLEMVVLAMLTATYGFNFIYYMLPIYLVIHFFILKYTKQSEQQSFGRMLSLVRIIAYLVLTGLTMLVTFKLLNALLNWSFVNSLFGILLFTVIYILVGGKTAVIYSRFFCGLIVLAISIITLLNVLYANHGVAILFNNLHDIAVSQGVTSTYYTKTYFDQHWLLIAVYLCCATIAFYLMNGKLSQLSVMSNRTIKALVLISRLVVLLLMLLPGLIALATELGSFKSGSQIITYQAQLPDGGVGYVVRAINKNTPQLNSVVNLIPQTINSASNLVETNKYNYILAPVVYFRHYLGGSMAFTVIVLLLSLFVYSVSHYLISGVGEFIYGIMLPSRFNARYGAEGLLWLSRLSLVMFAFLALILARVFMRYFNLLEYITSFTIIFLLLVLLLGIYDKTKKK